MYSNCTDHTLRTHVCIGSRCLRAQDELCAEKNPSSTRHVSPFAARDTEHFVTYFLLYLSCVAVVLFCEPRPVVHVSNYPLRRSRAGWHFYGIPLLHRLRAQKDRAQQESGQTTNRIIDDQDEMKKLVSNSCPTANHCYTQSTTRQRALRRRPTRTSKTSNYVRCWLHHCIFGNFDG